MWKILCAAYQKILFYNIGCSCDPNISGNKSNNQWLQ